MIDWLISLWEGLLGHSVAGPEDNVTGYAEPNG